MDDRASRGLYLHIPFCQQRCHFCAFYLEIHQPEAAEAFVESLLAELQLYGAQDPFDGAPLDSIYFGGGTPTTLTPQHLSKLLSTARRTFGLAQDAEIRSRPIRPRFHAKGFPACDRRALPGSASEPNRWTSRS